jgi:hypothetical protein
MLPVPPVVPVRILTEYLDANFRADTPSGQKIIEAIAAELADYRSRKALWDAFSSTRLQKYEDLRKAIQIAGLDEGDCSYLSGPQRHDIHGALATLTTALNEAIDDDDSGSLRSLAEVNPGRHQPTKTGRYLTMIGLAEIFHEHYRLERPEEDDHLADFLKELLDANHIDCPADHRTILRLLEEHTALHRLLTQSRKGHGI